ncbi:MAG: ROK family protein [Sphingobacteriales bacterium]|jgi:glucokinase|nr:ROK family protein [Sphingobacteriales bacterium]
MYSNDSRIVLTLDAGGTNFVFSAIQANKEIVEPVTMSSRPDDLGQCLSVIVKGFLAIREQLKSSEVAISFAFPGPADYESGIIGDLPNFPAFRGGVALGPFLMEIFNLPVFINNDGNLFAYGEALAGALPAINNELQMAGASKRYKNLLGVTLGTGFGGGVVLNNVLLTGDNGCGGDVWCSANKLDNKIIAEEGVSIRAVNRVYNELVGIKTELTPKDIFDIAEGIKEGNRQAAINSFVSLGEIAGYTIAEFLNIVDGIVVVGGGISKAHKYILPAMVTEMNGIRKMISGAQFPRLQTKAYNLTDADERKSFIKEEPRWITIPGTDKLVAYNTGKKTGVAISRFGTDKAIALGAYAYALGRLDKK